MMVMIANIIPCLQDLLLISFELHSRVVARIPSIEVIARYIVRPSLCSMITAITMTQSVNTLENLIKSHDQACTLLPAHMMAKAADIKNTHTRAVMIR